MTIQFLCDDLSDLIDRFDENPHITPAQKAQYPKKPKGKRITHDMLGNDHPNSLRLLAEDGWDGKPVGSLSARSAKSYWDYNYTNHVFMPTGDIVRFSVFMHLDLYHSLALALKGDWEDFFAHEMGWPSGGQKLRTVLRDEDAAQKAKNNFNPDTAVIFELFEAHGEIASQAGYDPKTFDTLVQEMILNDLHLLPNNSPELQAFIDRTIAQRELLKTGTPEQQEQFWINKCVWLELEDQLGEWLLRLEDRRLENANINGQWLAIFGETELELAQQRCRRELAELRLLLKEADPELDEEALEKQVAEEEEKRRKELENLMIDIITVPTGFGIDVNGGKPIEDAEDYKRKCKAVLRELWRLLHPDKLEQNPAYAKLTEAQKAYLQDLGRCILEIKPEELGYPQNFWESKHRSLESLQEALAKAKAILALAGLDIDVRYVIEGETLVEQLEWLEKAIEHLEREIENVRAELKALMELEDIRGKQAVLACPEQHEKINAELLQRAEKYRKEAEELEAELATLFNGGAS